MKKIKVVILLLIVLLVSGCSGVYNLEINKDLTVKEELNLVLDNESSNYDKINDLLNRNKTDNSEYKLVNEGDNLNLSYTRTYDSIEDYLLESPIYKQLFDNITYNTDRKEISLEASNILNLKSNSLNYSNNVRLIQINVTTPFKILEENSDLSSENTYSWTINNNTQEKDIFISFSTNSNKLNTGTKIIIATMTVAAIIILIIIIKRLLESRKI